MDAEGKEQLKHLNDELLARSTELSRQKSLVSDLQRTCDDLRDENKRLSGDVQRLNRQASVIGSYASDSTVRQQSGSPSLKNVVADHEVRLIRTSLIV